MIPRQAARRWVLVGLAVLITLALALFPFPPPAAVAHICQPDPVLPVGGVLLVPNGSGLGVLSLDDRSLRSLPILPASGVVGGVARSHTGDRLAVSRFSRAPGEPIGGADILLTAPEGGTPLLTIARERPGELLSSPAWLPDGGLVFERRNATGTIAEARVERVAADGSGRQVLLSRAVSPAVSPDGGQLAFIRSDPSDQLVVRALDGGPERVSREDPSFIAVTCPRFSPDGAWIAFSAIADSPAPPPTPTSSGGLSFLLPATRVAHAHGLPWDVWLIHPDGSGLRRLTFYYDDDPAPAWSPDGRWLAIFAGESIKVVSPEGPAACILDRGGYGSFEWLPA